MEAHHEHLFDLNQYPTSEAEDDGVVNGMMICGTTEMTNHSTTSFNINSNRDLLLEDASGVVLSNLNSCMQYETDELDDTHTDIELQDEHNTELEDNMDERERDASVDIITGGTVTNSSSHPPCKRRFLTNEDRRSVCRFLLNSSCHGKLNEGTTRKVASMYSVSIRVIQRIWQQFKETGEASHKRTRNCGRKRIQLDLDRVREIPLSKRTTLRSLACALDINKTSLIRLQKDGIIRRHSNAIKPFLKEENMNARLRFCLSMLEFGSIPNDPKFKTMHNIIHVDEKWFYMTKKNMNYYLATGEEEPHRTCRNKNFIGKVMFLVVLAKPRFDVEGNETFSGKIGVFPFITKEPAKRRSANRDAGTMETKPISSINKEVSKFFMIHKVLPVIKEKWPIDDAGETIFIQQDNAPCHIDDSDEDFQRVAREGQFDIRLISQPPNSPDLNVLDLGFFRAIQALQHQEAPKTIDDLVQAVEKSFENFSSFESNKIFLTLQSCMIEIMKAKGSNKYKIPHYKKDMLQRQGALPNQLKCDSSIVQAVLEHLGEFDGLQPL